MSSDELPGAASWTPRSSRTMSATDWPPFGGSSTDRGRGRCRRAATGRHPSSRAGRPPRLRDRPRAGARRDGGGLPRPEQAHGASGSAQGRRRAVGRAARRARPVPPRGPVGRQAATQEYRRRLLGHAARREHRPRHGVHRRGRPGEDGEVQRPAAGGPRLLLHPPGGAGLAARPRAGHGPPRHQAGQPDLRPRGQEGRSSRCSTSAWPR